MAKVKKETKKQKAEAIRRIYRVMGKSGLAGGVEIAAVAAKLHKNAICVIPLYRSCIVVLPPKGALKQRGAVELKVYHDPCWMGADGRTRKNLPTFCESVIFWGQRSGPNITRNGDEVVPFGWYEHSFSFHPTDKFLERATKVRKYSKGGGSYSLADRPWWKKIDPEVQAELSRLGYNVSPPIEWIPPLSSMRLRKPKGAKK